MKQTIDINGVIITIETTDETIKVSAEKEGEVVESFDINLEEGAQEQGQGQSSEETTEEPIQGQDEINDFGGDEFEEEAQLESFKSYIDRISK